MFADREGPVAGRDQVTPRLLLDRLTGRLEPSQVQSAAGSVTPACDTSVLQ